MADNPYVNKVEFGNQTIMDITDTTAEESDVAEGKVFYKGTGERSVGTAISLQEIVRTGVTATAGTAVRIPASGTDSRISTANTCVVKPISDAKSDGTPYKYRSCKVYSGYVEITYAENISNIAVGVEVVNY